MSRTADSVLLCFGFASPRLLSQVRDLTRCSACPRKRVCPRQPEKKSFSQENVQKKIRDVRTHSTCGGKQPAQHSASSAFPHQFAFWILFDCLFQTERDPERAFLFSPRRSQARQSGASQPTAV